MIRIDKRMQTKKAGVPDEDRLSPKPLDEREWIVMFVDIEGSTRLKYQQLSPKTNGTSVTL